MYKPVVLIVLDGWGISNSVQGNPIREATLPTFEKLNRFYPMTTLQASGISVGLPWNTAGNSEVGHMTMGTGRVIYQNMPRISLAIQDGSFFKNEVLRAAIDKAKTNKGARKGWFFTRSNCASSVCPVSANARDNNSPKASRSVSGITTKRVGFSR